ncbi:uncharacterized protein [Dermacentor albipictus]|uniref:uncharacterized protein n=1 Tax=Dermacentor albipictus TaxID=60249 RepID=UPI0031FE0B8D
MYIEDSTIGVFAIAAIMLRIQSNLCLIYGNLDKEERDRYVTLNLVAGALCEFFGLMYLLDFVTSRQNESLSILQCIVPRITSVHPTAPSVAPPANSATTP